MIDTSTTKAEKLIFQAGSLIPRNWRLFSPKAAADYRELMRARLENQTGLMQMQRAEIAALLRTRTVSEISNDPEASDPERTSAYLALNTALYQKWVTPSQLQHINKEVLMEEAETGDYRYHIKILDRLFDITTQLNQISKHEANFPSPSKTAIKSEMDFCKGVLSELYSSGKVTAMLGKSMYAEGGEHLPACIAQMGLGDNACFTRIHGPYIAVRESNKFFLGYMNNLKENDTQASYIPLHEPVHLTRENINLMSLATDCFSEIVISAIASRLATGLEDLDIHLRGAKIDVFIPLEDDKVLSLTKVESGHAKPIVRGRILGFPMRENDQQSKIEFARTFYTRYIYNDTKLCNDIVYDLNPIAFKPCDAYTFVSKVKKLTEVESGPKEQILELCTELNLQREVVIAPQRKAGGVVLFANRQEDMGAAEAYLLMTPDGQELARFSDPINLWSAITSNEKALGLSEGEMSRRMEKLRDSQQQQLLEDLPTTTEPGI